MTSQLAVPVLTIPQWVACAFYVALALLCLAWMVRFHRFFLYAIPPLTVAAHGLLFYSSYFTGYTNQVLWSPYLRIHGTSVFILMMLLMWEKMVAREKAVKLADSKIGLRAAAHAAKLLNDRADLVERNGH